MWSPLRAGLEPDLAQHPLDDSEAAPDFQQEKMLRSAASDYIYRIVDGRGLRQRVITQPRPEAISMLARLLRNPKRQTGKWPVHVAYPGNADSMPEMYDDGEIKRLQLGNPQRCMLGTIGNTGEKQSRVLSESLENSRA